MSNRRSHAPSVTSFSRRKVPAAPFDRFTDLRTIGVSVSPSEIPGFHRLALSETDFVARSSVQTQTKPETSEKSFGCCLPPVDRYAMLDETEKKLLRIGDAIVNLDFGQFPNTVMSGKVKSSGDDIVRNVAAVMQCIKNALGGDAKSTPFRSVLTATAAVSGVHRDTVSLHIERSTAPKKRLLKDMGKKERNRNASSRLSLLQRFKLNKHIHEMWKNEQLVSVDVLLEWSKANIEFKGERTTFFHTLCGMGYRWRKRNHNAVLEERPDIIMSRKKYLMKKADLDSEGYYFGAIDETWCHDGMTPGYGWQLDNGNMYKRARMSDLNVPMSGPKKGKQKGSRGIVLSVLTEDGVLRGSEQVLISGIRPEHQTEDYHSEMSGDTYAHYLKTIVPLLKQQADKKGRRAAILIDNAPYHSVASEKPPTSTSVKADILAFLHQHKVPHCVTARKPELFSVMKAYIARNGGRSAFTTYALDEWSLQQGVQVVRLPPYHCFWNPIEFLWANLKQHLRREGKLSDNLEIVRDRTIQFLRNFPAEAAIKLFKHTQKSENDVREMMLENAAQYHDESFELVYDIDQNGGLVNVGIDDEGELCDDDGDLYDDFDSYDEEEDDAPGTSTF